VQNHLSSAGKNNAFNCDLGYGTNKEQLTANIIFDTPNQHRITGTHVYFLIPASKKGCTIPVRAILTKPKTNGYDVKLESITITKCKCSILENAVHSLELAPNKLSKLISNNA
jgi:hypothetical protein